MKFTFCIDSFVYDKEQHFEVLLIDPDTSTILFTSGDTYPSYADAVFSIGQFMDKTDDPDNFVLLEEPYSD